MKKSSQSDKQTSTPIIITNKQTTAAATMDSQKIVAILLAIFLPPLGVFLQCGLGVEFWLDLVLTLLAFFPGMLYALYVTLTS